MLDYLWMYLAVFVAIQALTWLVLRSEPTAHGQIVGTQMGCLVGLFWPIALPYFAVMGLVYLWMKQSGRLDA